MSENKTERALWGSRIGFLMAAVGSAVGLGNIWRFSFQAYKNGGGAFLVPYFIALIVAGIPLMILEYALGHSQRGSTPLAFHKVSKRWEFVGWWMPIVATMGILFFYSVVIAWCLDYFVFSFTLAWGTAPSKFFGTYLGATSGADILGGLNIRVLISTAIIWFLCWIICFREVNHGIEKACLVFMPLLLVLTAILVGTAVTLDGAGDGIAQYLKPDWDKINFIKNFNDTAVWDVWTSAFGQIFFTLSLGFGIMITYASYLPKKTDIVGNALWTCIANCAYSIFAGFAVFGILGFMAHTQGVPLDQVATKGGGLAFIVYPQAINQLPFSELGKGLFGAAFFLALVVAGFSSAISLIEAFVCAITDKFNITRGGVVTFICVGGFLGSMIFATGAGPSILDLVDHYANHALIMAGILECVLVGWIMKAEIARKHVNGSGGLPLPKVWNYTIKYVTPAILILILFLALKSDVETFTAKDFKYAPTIVYGIRTIAFTLLFAWGLTMFKWYRKTPHKPEEEHILT
jgi:NSS family neurotransmitter:Na+ symporter